MNLALYFNLNHRKCKTGVINFERNSPTREVFDKYLVHYLSHFCTPGGAAYLRWGRRDCPGDARNTVQVYEGKTRLASLNCERWCACVLLLNFDGIFQLKTQV